MDTGLPSVPDAWTLVIACAHCSGALALGHDDLPSPDALRHWICPRCATQNGGKFPCTIKWVRKSDGLQSAVSHSQ